jgi:hypothetical protein
MKVVIYYPNRANRLYRRQPMAFSSRLKFLEFAKRQLPGKRNLRIKELGVSGYLQLLNHNTPVISGFYDKLFELDVDNEV